ncbi:MAG TPA: 6,7-dimethyl-8-ribityllumazine synthase [Acidimicrobiales bacterium]|nr:6,7-dimethyl-8-ribityllumazine synthase [Acidimicrobiales bacterium]
MMRYAGRLRGDGVRIAVVTSRFNDLVTDRLLAGCLDGLDRLGVDPASVTQASVPGALELPLAAQRLASSGDHDAVICLGAVIRGATDHHIHVGGQCAAGLARIQLDTGIPVVFGVLTTDSVDQALERAGGKSGNKGYEAAATAVEMVDLLSQLPKAGQLPKSAG